MNIGLFIVGDEILSGKRQDKHFSKVVEILSARGLQLSWVQYLGDDRQRCVEAFKASFSSKDLVFCCGGIGATPDDHTRQAVAAALGLPLVLHPEARELITIRTAEMAAQGRGHADMSRPENLQRLKMGEFPEGACIIPNPYNRIPGFNFEKHWFLPGFPVMAWPMIEAILETHYRHFFGLHRQAEVAMKVTGIGESDATFAMEAVERDYPGIKVFCLPSVGEDGRQPHIELGVKGDPDRLLIAFSALKAAVLAIGANIESA